MILVLFLLAAFDFAFEKWRYKEDLKMTTKEVKDEAKESEGDPQIKVKRRQAGTAPESSWRSAPGSTPPRIVSRFLAISPP